MSQNPPNSKGIVTSKDDYPTSEGSSSTPTELPLDLDKRDLLGFLTIESRKLLKIISNSKHANTISEQIAEEELKEIIYLEETLDLVGRTTDEMMTPTTDKMMTPTTDEMMTPSWSTSDEISTAESFSSAGLLERIGALSDIANSLETLPYRQRKLAVFHLTIEFFVRWINQVRETSTPPETLEVLIARSMRLAAIYNTYFIQQARVDKTEKSLLAIDPTIVEDIASFLEEAVQEIPDLITLETWRKEIMRSIGRYIYGEWDFNHAAIQEITSEGLKQSWRIHELMTHFEGGRGLQNKQELLKALYQVLVILNSSGILSANRMMKLVEAIQGVQPPAMKLHQRLESSGAYAKLDPRRRTMLQTYLTTETPIPDLGKIPEVGIRSRSRLTELLHSGMEVAFYNLPPNIQAEYDNDPMNALRTRSAQQTNTKSERLKQSHSKRKNPDTNKIEFSATHKQHLTKGNLRRWQRDREARKTTNTPNQP